MAFENYLIHLGILIAIYSILTISLNWAVGFTGLLNLGHIGFFGIGAYVSALLAVNGIPVFMSIIIGGIAGLIAGFLLALPTSRLKGDYLALATLGFSFILGSVARNWTEVTRGALGIPGIPKVVQGNIRFLIIVLIITAITYFIFWKLSHSRFGKTCEAVRDDELAAKMLGKDTFMAKMLALSVSAFFAGIAGGFFAHYITFIDPSIFGIEDLILLFSMMVVGGLASVKGAAVGTIILFLLPEPLRFIGFPSAVLGPMRAMIFALILLLILIYKPKGLFGRVDLA
ncbi:MAG: branched-chain amino acid ABC transporter permease [Candidatus Woesearchaeota archaeon]